MSCTEIGLRKHSSLLALAASMKQVTCATPTSVHASALQQAVFFFHRVVSRGLSFHRRSPQVWCFLIPSNLLQNVLCKAGVFLFLATFSKTSSARLVFSYSQQPSPRRPLQGWCFLIPSNLLQDVLSIRADQCPFSFKVSV